MPLANKTPPFSPKLEELKEILRQGKSVLIEELWDAPKALIAAYAQQITQKNLLIITAKGQEEARLFHDLPLFSDCSLIDFPSWETLPSEDLPPSPDIVGERYAVLKEIASQQEPLIVLTNLQACLQRLLPQQQFQKLYKKLCCGDSISFSSLTSALEEMGYERCPVASDKGTFALRGGIIDLFPVSSPDPFRLEFFGDEITSIRIYDPVGQKSIKKVESVKITPAKEKELIAEKTELSSLIDYLGPNTIVILDDLLAIENRWAQLIKLLTQKTNTFATFEQFLDEIVPLQTLYLCEQPIEKLSTLKVKKQMLSFDFFNRSLSAVRWKHPFQRILDTLCLTKEATSEEELLHQLTTLDPERTTLEILSSTVQEEAHLKQKIDALALNLPSNTTFSSGYLSSGFAIEESSYLLLPQTELTHQEKIRRQKQRSTYHTPPTEVYTLEKDDLIVHMQHGIGRFLGIEKRPNSAGKMTEFFLIEYAKGSKLFVPLSQAHQISKYIGAKEETPPIHIIGGNRWKRTREHTLKAIQGYAKDLLHLYATRSVKQGTPYSADSEMMQAFEEEFPFVETEDQQSAITAIKQDLSDPKPSDRLILGDVGYGKTEVAMRAAFKTVVDGNQQVALLVPTTVLAQQHFETFQERMRNYPVTIGLLSRFCSPKQIRDTLEKTALGGIDIVIGTHRMVSKDVTFKDLGLVIIDEEQRFGVRAKEHLKKLKSSVNCLTLSATPIPRTLYMSLIGARDMSPINTPPQDRVPITTVIAESHDEIIKNALLREFSRDGQAFVIHNRVESIYLMANRIKKLLPEARVIVAHGQMHADEIDSSFHQFKTGQADILIATTIIENGIDIPNANTILVDRADHYGLADLYQLRGRVGRWNRRAWAYFLVGKKRALTEISRKRLNAIAETIGYGGGMKIAMRDLEIRGAGDILGVEQSGNISAIGFHLYCKLLKRTVQTLQGKTPTTLCDARVDLPIDARLPEQYINEASLRMEIYQRLGEAMTNEDVEEILREMKDRFGKPPKEAVALYHLTRLRIFAAHNGFSLIKCEKGILIIEQYSKKKNLTTKLPFNPPKSPKALEENIIQILKRRFRIEKIKNLKQT